MAASSRRSTFRQDPQDVGRQAEDLIRSFEADSRLAREEVVGAELLFGRDLVANIGILWDTAEQLGDLCARQARHLVEDHLATLTTLASSRPEQVPAVLSRHFERRLRHVGQGWAQGAHLLAAQSEKAGETLLRFWAPFAAVVRQDWSGRGNRRGR